MCPGFRVRKIAYAQSPDFINPPSWLLTGIVDENATRFATFSYDNTGRAIATVHAGGVEQYQFDYSAFWPVVVTDPLGVQRTFAFSNIGGAEIDKSFCDVMKWKATSKPKNWGGKRSLLP